MSSEKQENIFMKVWDLPLRIFHWALMISIMGCFVSGKMENWAIHERFGMSVMALILFRIIWGFIGSETAQFRNFLTMPKAVFATAKQMWKKRSSLSRGHSPVGGYATLALLAIPLVMAFTGSISTDDILYDGPFYHLASEWSQLAGRIHHLGEKAIIAIVILHLGALGFYWFALRKNIITPMVTGRQKHLQGEDVTLSKARSLFGLCLLGSFIIIAQWAITLRPDYF